MNGNKCKVRGCSRHSVARRLCKAHYQAAWAAGELGQHEKLPPRAPKRGHVCPPEHKHADATTCYIQHQCRCDACRADHAARDLRRKKLKAYGRFDTGLVDAEPVREHVLMLGEYGIGYKRVAALAGIHVTPVRNLIWGRQDPGPRYGEIPKQIKRETAQAILAVQPSLEALGARIPVPAGPYVRRVQALVALGWSQSKISEAIGIGRSNFTMVRAYELAAAKGRGGRVKIAAETARKIVALYDDWSNRQPPESTPGDRVAASRARAFARARGWALPMDWEALDNDFTKLARRSAA